jgi:hypothetical protein
MFWPRDISPARIIAGLQRTFVFNHTLHSHGWFFFLFFFLRIEWFFFSTMWFSIVMWHCSSQPNSETNIHWASPSQEPLSIRGRPECPTPSCLAALIPSGCKNLTHSDGSKCCRAQLSCDDMLDDTVSVEWLRRRCTQRQLVVTAALSMHACMGTSEIYISRFLKNFKISHFNIFKNFW